MESFLLAAALVAVFITLGIVGVLVCESLPFFEHVSLWEFLTDTMWTPLFADARYGILPLVAGTLVTTVVALAVALPVGTIVAIYLSEFAPHRAARDRQAGAGAAQRGADGGLRLLRAAVRHALAAEAHSRACPASTCSRGHRDGHHDHPLRQLRSARTRCARCRCCCAKAPTPWARHASQTALRVVVPGALSGIAAAYILGISRAIGETMIVAIAAGMQPNLTVEPAPSPRRRSPRTSCRSASATCRTAASVTSRSSRPG